MDLSAKFDGELVLVVPRGDPENGILYTHEEFLGAFQSALLERLASMVPNDASSSAVCRAVVRLKTKASHQATLKAAVKLLRREGNPVDPTTLREGKDNVVAVLPSST